MLLALSRCYFFAEIGVEVVFGFRHGGNRGWFLQATPFPAGEDRQGLLDQVDMLRRTLINPQAASRAVGGIFFV